MAESKDLPKGYGYVHSHGTNPNESISGAAEIWLNLCETYAEITSRGDIPVDVELSITYKGGDQTTITYKDPNTGDEVTFIE